MKVPPILSVMEKEMLKTSSVIVKLSISFLKPISFCLMYFEALLVSWTFRIIMTS